jgi:hypothetical protein
LTLEGRESKNEEDLWTKIKAKINLSISFDDKHIEELWYLLFQDIFAWHKGEHGHSTIGEHTINTQGLPPCQMTPRKLSY